MTVDGGVLAERSYQTFARASGDLHQIDVIASYVQVNAWELPAAYAVLSPQLWFSRRRMFIYWGAVPLNALL